MGAREAYELLQQYKAENAAGGGASNGNGGGSGSAPSRRTSPLEDYYNEKRQKQAIEKANEIINSDILHGGTKPVGWQQKTAQPSGTSGASTSSRGRGLVGGLRDAWLDKHPNVTTISAKDLPSANQTVYDLQQRKKELEGEKTKNARYSLVDGVLTNNNTDYDAEIADIDKRIAETKKQDDYRTVWDKLVDTVAGAVTGSAASKSDAMRTLYESGQNSRTAEYEREIAQLQKDYDRAKRDYEETLELEGEDAAQWAKNTLDDVERKLNAYKKVVDENVQQKATQATADLADQLQQDSAERIERAKDGSGAVGRFSVDAGVAATQMGIDALTGRALGIGDVGSKASMALRAFGGGTQEARQGGGDLKQQLGYGGGVAAVELITEKLFDGLAGIYGKGTLDKVAEGVIGNLAKTDAGRTALRVLEGGIGEGSEELISDALNPLLRTIYNGKTVGESYSEEQIADWGYDFLVGAVLGAGGKTVDIATGENAKKNAELRSGEVDKAFELMTGKKAASEPQSAAETQGDITTPPTPSNDAVARPEELNSTVNNNAEMQTTDAQKNTAPTGTENAAGNSVVSKIREATPQLEQMKNVSSVSGTEIGRSGKIVDRLMNFVERIGGKVTREGFGVVELTRSKIKSSMIGHGVGDAKIDTFAAVPDVIANGMEIDHQSNWKGRNYDTYLFAAPVEYKGEKTYVGVVVQKDSSSNRYYLHEVVDANGDVIFKNDAAPASTPDGTSALSGDLETVVDAKAAKAGKSENIFSDTSIPTAEQNVNSGQAENSGSSEQRAKTNLGSKSTRAKTSQAVETLMEADITPEARQEQLNPYIKKGRFDYIPDTNKAQVSRATKKIANVGWEQAVKDFHDNVISGKSSKDLVAEGAILLNNAANSDASGRAYLDLANDFIEMAHRAGETLQAIKIVQQLSPEGRLYLITKTVAKINKNLTPAQRKAIAQKELGTEYDAKAMKKAAKEDIRSLDKYGVKINEDFADKYINAKTEVERDNLLSELQKDIAKQMPSTFGEKFTAFRYTAMLGNFKTQERNILGNTASLLTKLTKDRLAAGIEGIGYVVSGGKMERTRSVWAGGKLYKEAFADFSAHKAEALGEPKYTSVGEKTSKEIEDNRTIFKVNGTWGTDDASKPFARSIAAKGARKVANGGMAVLEGWRKGTNWAMEAGDAIFARTAYADAMAGWLKAHKINSFAEATEAQLDKARQFAAREAQEATFRDSNAVSDFVSELGTGWHDSDNVLARGAAKTLDAIIPFRKTPANVAVRAVEYSPLGIAETIYKGIQAAKGEVNAADVINSACKNATGAAIFAAGWFMKMAGNLRGKEDDDERDRAQKATGAMDYAVKIGNKWVSLSQLSPISIPLFMGVRFAELTEDGEFQLKDIWPLIKGTTSPMLDQSMMQGLNDALTGLDSYGSDQDAIGQFIENAMLSYASEYVPTIVRQFEQAREKNRQSTYTDKNNPFLSTDAQYKIGKISAGVPGWDYNQSDYIDMWGRKTSQGGAAERYFNAFLNPFYTSEIKREPLDDELERLYDAGKDIDGFPSVYPDSGSKYINLDGNGMQMTQEQFDSYRIERGTKSRELAKEFVESDEYKLMSDIQRAEVLRDLYSLAADRALKSVKTSNGIAYTGKLDDVAKLKDVPEYYASKEILSGAKDNTKENFDAIDQVLKNFGHLKDDTQTALRDSTGLYVDKLLYAKDSGIGSKDWFDTHSAIKEHEKEVGKESQWVSAEAIGSQTKGDDAAKLKALEAQLPPDDDGKRKSIVKRYDSAIDSGISWDDWTEIEKVVNTDAGGWGGTYGIYSGEKKVKKALREAGYTSSQASRIWNVYKKTTDEKYQTARDDSSNSDSKSSSPASRAMDAYYRALGLIK